MKEFRYDVLTLHIVVIILSARGEIHVNAYELAKYIEDDIQIQEGIADMLRQQADRIVELEKFNKAILKKGGYPYEKSNPIAWMSPDGKVSTTEGILFHIPLYTTPQTNNKNRSWGDIYDEATAVWDSLDTSNQSNIECARAWFLEGYHQALTRGQE